MVAHVAGAGKLFRMPPAGGRMQVLCKATNGNAEIHCGVCGQGFILFWERESLRERTAVMGEMQETFRREHRRSPGRDAHLNGSFPALD
jgi:hypothetical protein